jgi:oxygen-independent coproporphyrinogen-3 oxidase
MVVIVSDPLWSTCFPLLLWEKKAFFPFKTMPNLSFCPPSARTRTQTLALYIHWPFCLSKCPYCDFNSHVASSIDEPLWEKALLTELRTLSARLPRTTHVTSIYFGGGTPSLMPPSLVEKLITATTTTFHTDATLEVTLEANPGTFDQARFAAFRAAGVNRLSLGIQSFDDEALRFLGRVHNSTEALKALKHSFHLFPRVSFDLIYGLQNQTKEAWQEQLNKAAEFEPSHISCYQLTFEPNTAFYTRYRRGDLTYPDEPLALKFDLLTEAFWQTKGLNRYEVSNYARPGFESRHNLAYWHSTPTLGVGPGAHGRPYLNGERHAEITARAPATWLKHTQEKGHALVQSTPLSAREKLEEWLLMGLRLTEGVALKDAQHLTGQTWTAWALEKHAQKLQKEGLITVSATCLRATREGRLKLNSILGFLLGT